MIGSNKLKNQKLKKAIKTSIGTQSDHITNTQANQIRALVNIENILFIDQSAVNAAIHAADTFAPIEVDDAIMRTRVKANATHAMEDYIPKQEKRTP